MSRTDSDRDTALQLLATFENRLLPGALRRVATWKSIPPRLLQEWREDALQELALDCLEHAAEIVALAPRDRHARWMRLAEAVVHKLHRQRLAVADVVEEPAAPEWHGQQPPQVYLPPLVTLNNGRPNVQASTKKNGHARRDLRRMLDRLLTDLGWDDDRAAFWQARAVEALTGLAADLLIQQGAIVSLVALPPPRPEERRQRLQRLGQKFPVQPSTLAVRSVLRPWHRNNPRPEGSARQMLEDATRLGPENGAAWLWLFEACCHDGDARGAARAVWRARRCAGTMRTAIVLARARLLELRGKVDRAVRMLQRSQSRWPRDSALRRAQRLADQSASSTTTRT